MASVAHLLVFLPHSAALRAVLKLKTVGFEPASCLCVEAVLLCELRLPQDVAPSRILCWVWVTSSCCSCDQDGYCQRAFHYVLYSVYRLGKYVFVWCMLSSQIKCSAAVQLCTTPNGSGLQSN